MNKIATVVIVFVTTISCNNIKKNIVGGSWTDVKTPSFTYRFLDNGEIHWQYQWNEPNNYNRIDYQGEILSSRTILRKGVYILKMDSIIIEFVEFKLPSTGMMQWSHPSYKFEGIIVVDKQKINMIGTTTINNEEPQKDTIELIRN